MHRASRRPRALARAALGLAVLLALGFAVDALLLVRARVRADGTAAIGGRAQAVLNVPSRTDWYSLEFAVTRRVGDSGR